MSSDAISDGEGTVGGIKSPAIRVVSEEIVDGAGRDSGRGEESE